MEANKQKQLLRQTAKSQNSFEESEDMRIGHCAFMLMGLLECTLPRMFGWF